MGASSLEELSVFVHRKFNEARTIERIISSPEFSRAYKGDPELLSIVVKSMNLKLLKELVNLDITYSHLEREAKAKKIKNYSRMSREQLLKELKYV